MKKVMVRAWQEAKYAARQFGGNARDYLSQALILAWAEYKAEMEKKNTEKTKIEKRLKGFIAKSVEFKALIAKFRNEGNMEMVKRGESQLEILMEAISHERMQLKSKRFA